MEVTLWSRGCLWIPVSDSEEILAGRIFLRTIELLAPPESAAYFSFNHLFHKIRKHKRSHKYIREPQKPGQASPTEEFIRKHQLPYFLLEGEDCEGLPWNYYVFEVPRSLFPKALTYQWQSFDIEGYVLPRSRVETLGRCLANLVPPCNFVTLITSADFVFEIVQEGATLRLFTNKFQIQDFTFIPRDRTIRKLLREHL